jgi:lysophospholipase L1-like esterase
MQRIRNETDAKLVWATTTPVHEGWHQENKPFARWEADVDAFNAAARQIAEEFDRPINDLFWVIMQAGRDDLLVQDGVHFNAEGYGLLGQSVANFLQQQALLV